MALQYSNHRILIFVIPTSTSSDRKIVSIEENSNIGDLKKECARAFGIDPETILIMFENRILQNTDNLKAVNIHNATTIQMIVCPPNILTKTNGIVCNEIVRIAATEDQNVGWQERMEQHLYKNNGQMLRSVLEDPICSFMLENPDIMRLLIAANPYMHNFSKSRPEIDQLLNDPEILYESCDFLLNPTLLNDAIFARNQSMPCDNMVAAAGSVNLTKPNIFGNLVMQPPGFTSMTSPGAAIFRTANYDEMRLACEAKTNQPLQPFKRLEYSKVITLPAEQLYYNEQNQIEVIPPFFQRKGNTKVLTEKSGDINASLELLRKSNQFPN